MLRYFSLSNLSNSGCFFRGSFCSPDPRKWWNALLYSLQKQVLRKTSPQKQQTMMAIQPHPGNTHNHKILYKYIGFKLYPTLKVIPNLIIQSFLQLDIAERNIRIKLEFLLTTYLGLFMHLKSLKDLLKSLHSTMHLWLT